MQVKLRMINSILLLIAIFASIPLVYYIGKPDTASLYLFDVLVTCLVVFPYFLLFIANIFFNQLLKQTITIYLVVLICIFFAAVVFYYDFFIDVTGQHGLALVGVPVLQIVLAVITLIIVYIQKKKAAR